MATDKVTPRAKSTSKPGCPLLRPRRWVTVEPVIFLTAFSNFLIYPAYVALVYDLVCQSTPNCSGSATAVQTNRTRGSCGEVTSQVEQEVQTVASHFLLYTNLAFGFPILVVSLLYGHLSDKWGRKVFILIPLAMNALCASVIVVVIELEVSMYFLLIGHVLNGLGGSFPVNNLVSYAYVSDITTSGGRTAQIGVLESMFYFAASIGGLLGGVTVQHLGYVAPYMANIVCNALLVFYVVCALPESVRSPPIQIDTTAVSNSDSVHWRDILSELLNTARRNRCHMTVVTLLLAIFFTVQMIYLGILDIQYLFALAEPLCWGVDLLGYFSAYVVATNGLASMFLLPLLTFLGFHDALIVCIGLISGILLLVGMGIATQTWVMFFAATLGALKGMYTPTLRSMLSKLTTKQHQGVMFAAQSILQTAATLVASVLYNSVYPPTRTILPGMSFLLMAGTLVPPLIAIFGLWVWEKCSKRNTGSGKDKHEDNTEECKSLLADASSPPQTPQHGNTEECKSLLADASSRPQTPQHGSLCNTK